HPVTVVRVGRRGDPNVSGCVVPRVGGVAGGAFAPRPGPGKTAVVRPTGRPRRECLDRGCKGFEGGDTPGGESVVCVFSI
ncbi:hypothetical protein QR98_0080760, partial [Sarcoptes scabiei]